MDLITVTDYRCFHGTQTAHMAPLTLAVGENSTGKTSFLAMIRALWDIAYGNAIPDFKEEPYDLGSFAEIAHHRGGRGSRADSFAAGFIETYKRRSGASSSLSFDVTFQQRSTAPVPTKRKVANGVVSVTASQTNGTVGVTLEADGGSWSHDVEASLGSTDDVSLVPLPYMLWDFADKTRGNETTPPSRGIRKAELLVRGMWPARRHSARPFASAPVRSKPRRTYDPSRPSRDPEGDYIPMYLAHTYRQAKKEWTQLKAGLEAFGKTSGLFDEILIKSLGSREGTPFHVQVRKRGRRTKGPMRNLIDMGYGVSQVLPLITEILRPDGPSVFLLQQPEVHLHPSAQAALGTLFCDVATRERQLVVETHSDHLLNRIRLDIRDGNGHLRAEDVSILYFERDELEVHIHSLRLDEDGNIRDAPESYGRFFMGELARSLAG